MKTKTGSLTGFGLGKRDEAILQRLRNKAGVSLIERLTVTIRLLGNVPWINSPMGGGGSSESAKWKIQNEYLGEFCSRTFPLDTWLAMYREASRDNFQEWKDLNLNADRIFEAYKNRHKVERRGKKPAPPSSFPTPAATKTMPENSLRRELNRAVSCVTGKDRKIEKLGQLLETCKKEKAALEKENVSLRAELAQRAEEVTDLRRKLSKVGNN